MSHTDRKPIETFYRTNAESKAEVFAARAELMKLALQIIRGYADEVEKWLNRYEIMNPQPLTFDPKHPMCDESWKHAVESLTREMPQTVAQMFWLKLFAIHGSAERNFQDEMHLRVKQGIEQPDLLKMFGISDTPIQ